MSFNEQRAIRRDCINELLQTPNAVDIRQCVRARETQLFGYELKAYASPLPDEEPESEWIAEFEKASDEGKLDMFAEAESNISQLEAIIAEQKSTITELAGELKKAMALLTRSKHIIEGQSKIPHLIEGDLETAYWRIDELLEKHNLSSYKFIAAHSAREMQS